MKNFIKKTGKYFLMFIIFIILCAILTFLFNNVVDRFFFSGHYDNSLKMYIEEPAHIEFENSKIFMFLRELFVVTISILASIKFLSFKNEKKAFIILLFLFLIYFSIILIYGFYVGNNNSTLEFNFNYSIAASYLLSFLFCGIAFFRKSQLL